MSAPRPALTGRGVAAAVLGVVAVSTGLGLGYVGVTVLGVVLLLAVAGSLVSLLGSPPLRATREVRPLTVARGDACSAVVALTAAVGWRATELLLTDALDGLPVPLAVDALTWSVPTSARGRLAVGPLRARREGTFALAAVDDTLAGVATVQVLPRVLPARALPAGAVLTRVGAERLAEVGGTDLVALHGYQPGDDLRRLHWAASARAGALMVREDSEPGSALVVVVLDDVAASADAPAFEEMVDVAASLVAASLAEGHLVRLVSASGALDVEVAAGAGPGAPGALALAGARQHGERGSGRRASGDVAVVVGGPRTRLSELAALADGVGWSGAVLVDPSSTAGVAAMGGVTVVRGSSAVDALAAWSRLAR